MPQYLSFRPVNRERKEVKFEEVLRFKYFALYNFAIKIMSMCYYNKAVRFADKKSILSVDSLEEFLRFWVQYCQTVTWLIAPCNQAPARLHKNKGRHEM